MNNKVIVEVKGLNGIIKIFDDRVVISRKTATGFLMQGIKGDRTIYFSDIKSIEYKKPTMMANGYIQFITNAEMAKNQKVGLLGSTVEATKDPNTVIVRAFSKETVRKSEEVYNEATKILSKYKQTINFSHSNSSDADEILKFKNLLDQGIITEEEFLLKKKNILGL